MTTEQRKVRLVVLRTYYCPDGSVTGSSCSTVVIESEELAALLTAESYSGTRLIGAELIAAREGE